MLFVLRDWHRLILIIHQSFQFFPSSHLLQVTRLQNSPWALWLTDPGQGSSVPRGRFRSDPVTVQSSFHCCCSLPFRCNLCSCNPWKTEKAKMCFYYRISIGMDSLAISGNTNQGSVHIWGKACRESFHKTLLRQGIPGTMVCHKVKPVWVMFPFHCIFFLISLN